MNPEYIRQLITNINVWKKGNERAPHKPLLLLYALSKCSQGISRKIPYTEIDKDIRHLLIEFGPTRKHHHPEYPFWWLQSDGLWEVIGAEDLKRRTGHNDVRRSELLNNNVMGGLKKEIYETLRNDPHLLFSIVQELLDNNFPSSIHDDILAAVGLDITEQRIIKRRRDPNFRNQVLRVYEYRCAICNFNVRLGSTLIGLEAAHIKWHQAGGPDTESNGIALCSIHHKLFDRGVFTLSFSLTIEVSEYANGVYGFDEWLMRFHGNNINFPQDKKYNPEVKFLRWHREQVFHKPARDPLYVQD